VDGGQFESTDDVAGMLKRVGYLTDAAIASVVYLGERLGKPVLVEGPAGTGPQPVPRSAPGSLRNTP